jgi:hypothetical protein
MPASAGMRFARNFRKFDVGNNQMQQAVDLLAIYQFVTSSYILTNLAIGTVLTISTLYVFNRSMVLGVIYFAAVAYFGMWFGR